MSGLVPALIVVAVGASLLLLIMVRRRNLPFIAATVVLGAAAVGLLFYMEEPLDTARGDTYAVLWQLRYFGFSILFLAFWIALLLALGPFGQIYRNVTLAVVIYLLVGIVVAGFYIVRDPSLGPNALFDPKNLGYALQIVLAWPYQLLTITDAFNSNQRPV